MEKKSPQLIIKIVLDIIMLFLLVLFYRKSSISMSFHEWGGIIFFCLFILHLILNRKWIRSVTAKLFKKTTGIKLKVSWVVNFLLFISLTGIIITGIMINKTLPFQIVRINGAQQWHYFMAALLIILMGIHLGLHWPLFKGLARKVPLFRKKTVHIIGMLSLILTVGAGCYFLGTGSFGRWMTGPFIGIGAGPMQQHEGFDRNFENMKGGFEGKGNRYEKGKPPEGNMKNFKAREHMGQNPISVGNILMVIFTYLSELIVFAFITVLLSKIRIPSQHSKCIE